MGNNKANKDVRFDLYRFQIVPLNRYYQLGMFNDYSSIDELISNKNRIFYEAINSINLIEDKNHNSLIFNKKLDMDDMLLFQIAVSRSLIIETQQFTQEIIDNWPSFFISVWNDPDKQIIFTQERRDAYQKSSTVMNILESKLNEILSNEQLRIFIEPIYKKEKFWELTNLYEGKIRDVKFELITPNMANISGNLDEDLKDFARNTNTNKTTLSLNSAPESSLVLNRDDDYLEHLVDYSSQGGGDISIKVKGIDKRIHTQKANSSIKINEIDLQSNNPEVIVDLLKVLFRNEDN